MIDSRDDGASTVQTIMVVAIVGVLAYLATPIWGHLVERARAYTCQENQRHIDEAIDMARSDGEAGARVGVYDAPLETGQPWGNILIPAYLSKAPKCQSADGGLYNLAPDGQVRSDRGPGQYFFVNQGGEADHRWTGK